MIKKFVHYLQTRSYQTKGRILTVTVLVVVLGLGAVWINQLKKGFTGVSANDLTLQNLQPGQVLGVANYVILESSESRDGKRYLYFKVENNTDDILNFPDKSKINLTVKGKSLEPEAVQTRQQQPFQVKILSRTTNFGVMIFPEFEGNKGELVIRELKLEQRNELSQQTINVDFDKLKPLEELRS